MIYSILSLSFFLMSVSGTSTNPKQGNFTAIIPKTNETYTSQYSNLVWSDEFDYGISGDWVYDIGGGGWVTMN